jgi:CheY-like chemotaxis protein
LIARDLNNKDKPKTVLLVDDHRYSLIVLRKMIERPGVQTISVENGSEAVQICKERADIDLVLMDLKMPVMDGYNAMKEIKLLRPEIKIVAETAYALYGDRDKILDAGFDGYIPKPITKESLEEILKQYI